ncbi:hypothetical protein [Nocardia sp. SSK8]|uniref:hypothetical protein n=1 Tax=Nocardia sp. SSK8 TaxID=3120154 RepID=UPI00300AA61B
MKTLGTVAAGIAVTTVTMLGAGPAHAEITDPTQYSDAVENVEEGGFADYAAGRSYPRSCLVVQNHRGGNVHLRLNYPTSKGTWTFGRNQLSLLAYDGKVVKSPNGRWSVRTNPPVKTTWVYDADRNTSKGCNGSWVLTMN